MFRPGWLARVAFIGNLFFIVCLLLQYRAAGQEGQIVSLVAILGLVLGMGLFNPLSNLLNAMMLLRMRHLPPQVPAWLAIANFLFLISQLIYILHTWS